MVATIFSFVSRLLSDSAPQQQLLLLLLLLLSACCWHSSDAFSLVSLPTTTTNHRLLQHWSTIAGDVSLASERLSPQLKTTKEVLKNKKMTFSTLRLTPRVEELEGRIGLEEFTLDGCCDDEEDDDDGDGRLSLVLFHASWCKSCHKFQRLYHKLASSQADLIDKQGKLANAGTLRMAGMEWGANAAACKSLGIEKLPTIHFYKNGEKVAGYSCGPSQFQRVLDTIDYLQENYYENAKPVTSKEELELKRNLQSGSEMLEQAGILNGTPTTTGAEKKEKRRKILGIL